MDGRDNGPAMTYQGWVCADRFGANRPRGEADRSRANDALFPDSRARKREPGSMTFPANAAALHVPRQHYIATHGASLHPRHLEELLAVVDGEIVAADEAAADGDLVVLRRLFEDGAVGIAFDLPPHLAVVEKDDEASERRVGNLADARTDAVDCRRRGFFL